MAQLRRPGTEKGFQGQKRDALRRHPINTPSKEELQKIAQRKMFADFQDASQKPKSIDKKTLEAARRNIKFKEDPVEKAKAEKWKKTPLGKVSGAIGQANYLADNYDWLIKKATGGKHGLPNVIKQPLKRAGF